MLEHVACLLSSPLVVPRAPLRAILTYNVRRDVDVVSAVLRAPVMDRDPPAGRFSVCPREAHRVHEVRGDPSPDLITQGSFFW